MRKVTVTIKVSGGARYLDFCRLEGYKFDPDRNFRFLKGYWVGDFEDLQIGSDSDLDILIVAAGSRGANCSMTVQINGGQELPFDMNKPFNKSGWGFFEEEIKL